MILPLLFRFWPYIAIAVLSISLWGAIKYGQHQHYIAEQATEIANANAEIAEQERVERKRVSAILSKNQAEGEKRRKQFNQQRAEVSNAQDGTLAPVLRGVLDRLPEPPKATGPDEG